MFNDAKIFQKGEKVRIKHTLIECIIFDKFDCSKPKYWVLFDGKIIEKTENDLSYNVLKTWKINIFEIYKLIKIQYFYFFGTNSKQIKNSNIKILFGICVGILITIIFKH